MLTQQLFNGILLGATYSLVALGFTLIVGALDKLNFALGETSMVCAIVSSQLLVEVGLPFAVVFVLALAGGAALSVVIYFLSFRFVDRNYPTAPILSSLGVGVAVTAIVAKVWGPEQRGIPDVFEGTRFDLGLFTISGSQIVILVLAGAATGLLYVFLDRSAWGTAIRGVSDDEVVTALLGVPVQRVVVLTFAVAGMLAGSAGLLTGLALHTVTPFDGFETTLTALIIIVIGGLGSVKGAVVAGLGVGMIEVLSVAYLSASLRDLAVYLLVGAFLIARPQGLFGGQPGVLERV